MSDEAGPQLACFAQVLYGATKESLVARQKGNRVQFTALHAQELQRLIKLITCYSAQNGEHRYQEALEGLLQVYGTTVIFNCKRIITLNRNIAAIKAKLSETSDEVSLGHALQRNQRELDMLVEALSARTSELLLGCATSEFIVFRVMCLLKNDAVSPYLDALSLEQLCSLQGAVAAISQHQQKLALALFETFRCRMPPVPSNDIAVLASYQMPPYEQFDDFTTYYNNVTTTYISNYQCVAAAVSQWATGVGLEEIMAHLCDSKVFYQNINFTLLRVTMLFIHLQQVVLGQKKTDQPLAARSDVCRILQAIRQRIAINQTTYINIIRPEDNTDNKEATCELDPFNHTLWVFAKCLVLLYFYDYSSCTVDDWILFLEEFAFHSTHTSCNQMIEKLLQRQPHIHTDRALYEYLLKPGVLLKVPFQRRAGVYPLLFGQLTFDCSFVLEAIQLSVEQLYDGKMAGNEKAKVLLRLRSIVQANSQTQCINDETFAQLFICLFTICDTDSYVLRNTVFSCFAICIHVICLNKQFRKFNVDSVCPAGSAMEKCVAKLLRTGSKVQVLLVAEFISYLHYHEYVTPDSISEPVKSQYAQLFMLLVLRAQALYDDFYIDHVILRATVVFIGNRNNAMEVMLALHNNSLLNPTQIAYITRIIIRKYEFYKLKRGHSCFNELQLEENTKGRYRRECVEQLLVIFAASNAQMCAAAHEELSRVVEQL